MVKACARDDFGTALEAQPETDMKSAKILLSLFSVGILVGCGGEDKLAPTSGIPIPETAEENATLIERTFVAEDESIRQEAQTAAQAIQSRDYQKAANSIMNLQQAARTKEQSHAAMQSMRQFQRDLADAVNEGDPNAKAAAEFMQRRMRNR